MTPDCTPPEDILDAARFIKDANEQKFLTRADKENLNRAKLRIAFWALRQENVAASRENLEYVLGTDAGEIFDAYNGYLERAGDEAKEDRKSPKRGKRDRRGFWENA